jgi:adenylate kinase
LPGYKHVACGDVFRQIDLNSELGKVFLKYSSLGELVPDDFTVRLWRQHIDNLIHVKTFRPETETLVLDGIPRNVKQAEMLDAYIDVTKLVYLSADHDREEVVRRLKSRALKDNRLDDANEETIRHRLEIYERESLPVLSYYPKDMRIDIDSLQSPIEVTHDLISAILGRTSEVRCVPTPVGSGRR